MVNEYLSGFFKKGSLHFHEIVFDLSSEAIAEDHMEEMGLLADALAK
jgi:hypothetical protein